MTKKIQYMCLIMAWLSCVSCATRHEVEVKPVEVKPIHITIDVNIKVDKALDDFFGDLDETEQEIGQKIQENEE